MTNTGLVEALANQLGITKALASRMVKGFAEIIRDEVKRGGEVSVSSLGKFERRFRKARTGVNPQNPSQKIQIPARNVPGFKAAKVFKDEVNSK